MDGSGLGRKPNLPEFFSLVELDSVGSTNDVARARADIGAPDGTIIWAKQQVSGRGRRGRVWNSPEGNLYCSVILRPSVSPSVGAQLSFVTALALGEGLQALLPSSVVLQYKWPNDVLLDGKKIAGILLESQVGEYGNMEWVVIGTGVNVASYPLDAEWPATSLNQVGCQLAVRDILITYSHNLRTWVSLWKDEGFEPIRKAWLQRAIGIGGAIKVRLPNKTLQGTFDSLDTNGALVLMTADGKQRISAGEVFFPNCS